MTTITTRQGKGSALTYEEMDSNLTNLNEDKLETSGGTMTGNLTFANSGEGIVFSDATSITSADGLGKTYNVSAETATGGANLRLSDGTTTDDVKFAGSGATTVTRTDANTITISSTDTNTTYTAGSGLSLASTTFSHADTSTVANVTPASRTYVSGITFDTYGHVQSVSTGTETVVDTNTTYGVSAETATGGANLRLTGSDASTDDVKLASGTGITVSRTDANTITIAATVADTNTTYAVSAETTTGGANLRLTGSDASTDDVAIVAGTGATVTRTDANTITISATGSGLANVVEDTTPELGGNLDALDNDITNVDVLETDGIQFDLDAAEASAVGKLWWNANKETLSIGLDTDCVMNVGQHTYIYGKAAEAISKGQVVMFGGVQGDHVMLKVADATAPGFVSEWIIGIASDTLANNEFGHVTIIGEVVGVDTATLYNEGDILWFDPATPGGLTATEPAAPNAKVRMAAVTKENGSSGILLVRVGTSKALRDLNDVNTSGASNNDFLVYDSTAGVWQHDQLDISLDTSPTLGGDLNANGNDITGVVKIVGDATTNLVIDGGNNGTQKNISFVGDIDLWEPTSANSSFITNTNTDLSSINRLIRFKTEVGGSGWSGSTSGTYQGRVGTLSAYNWDVPATSTTGTQSVYRFGEVVGGIISSGVQTAAQSISGTYKGTVDTYTSLPGSPATNDFWWVIDESKFYKWNGSSWSVPSITPNDSAITTNSDAFKISHSVEPRLNDQTRMGDYDRAQTLLINLDVNPDGKQWGTLSGSGWGREQLKGAASQITVLNNGQLTSLIPMSTNVELRPHGLVANSGSDTLTIYGITGQSFRVGWTNQSASGSNRPVSTTVNNVAAMRVGTYTTGSYTVSGYSITNTIDNFSGLYWSNGGVVATNKYSLNVLDSSVVLRNDGPIQTATTLTLGNYASTAMPTGSIGMIVAVNDNGGKLAYWDTANSRWSYVSDDSAV